MDRLKNKSYKKDEIGLARGEPDRGEREPSTRILSKTEKNTTKV